MRFADHRACAVTVWAFEKQTNTWDVLSTTGTIPEPRVAHAQAVIDGSLYITGGRQVRRAYLGFQFAC